MHASDCLLAWNAPRWRANGGELKGYGKGEKMCQLTGMAHDLSNKDT